MSKDTCSECGCVTFNDPDEVMEWLAEPTIEQMIEDMGEATVSSYRYGLDRVYWRASLTIWSGLSDRTVDDLDTPFAAIRALYEKWKAQ